jgi:DNA invertase Pin-like site-specific DNA recombinase
MRTLRCAIYTRVRGLGGLRSQAHEGWRALSADDGGFSGGSMDRPALQRLLADIRAGLVDVVVVYKVDRLTRSLSDFAKLVELFEAHGVSFVSVTQAFNTTTSMGRLTLNVLLSFAQFAVTRGDGETRASRRSSTASTVELESGTSPTSVGRARSASRRSAGRPCRGLRERSGFASAENHG